MHSSALLPTHQWKQPVPSKLIWKSFYGNGSRFPLELTFAVSGLSPWPPPPSSSLLPFRLLRSDTSLSSRASICCTLQRRDIWIWRYLSRLEFGNVLCVTHFQLHRGHGVPADLPPFLSTINSQITNIWWNFHENEKWNSSKQQYVLGKDLVISEIFVAGLG